MKVSLANICLPNLISIKCPYSYMVFCIDSIIIILCIYHIAVLSDKIMLIYINRLQMHMYYCHVCISVMTSYNYRK